MSSVLDAIRRVLGRDRDHRPDAGASSEAAPPPQAGAAEPARFPTSGEPAPAMPGEEAELPIQPTAPPMSIPSMPSVPSVTASLAGTESPNEAGTVLESMEAEHAGEPSGPTGTPSGAAPEPLGNGSEPEGEAAEAGVGAEETVQHISGDELPAAAVGQVTAIEETGSAIVAEKPVADQEGQGQALADEPLLPSEASRVVPSSQVQPFAEALESATALQPMGPEESPEQQSAVESPESPILDENR